MDQGIQETLDPFSYLLLRNGFGCEFIAIVLKEHKDNTKGWEWAALGVIHVMIGIHVLLCGKTLQERLDVSCRWMDFYLSWDFVLNGHIKQ